uniref:C2H2-type domain-containing protein n=1 Tax=Leptobrachium leishanense TaxID=445787 RepID=A0A8C5Q0J6_9ANUR
MFFPPTDNSVCSSNHTPVSLPDDGIKNRTEGLINDEGKHLKARGATKDRAEPSPYAERGSPASDKRNVTGKDNSTSTKCVQTEYTTIPRIKEELDSCREGDVRDPDVYPPTNYTDIKMESPTCEGDLGGENMQNPLEHTQTEYPPACMDRSLKVITGSTDLITHNCSDNKNSMTSSKAGESFYQESDFIIYEVEGSEDEQNKASSECGEGFSRRSDRLRQKKLHKQKQTFLCSECEKPFTDKGLSSDFGENCTHRLDHNHQKVHTEEIPTLSSEREERFTGSVTFKEHQRIHAGIKLSRCTECGKCFPLPSALVRHQRIHTGEKPYKCDACGKCFTQASHLKSHRLIHTGEKPFKCSDCGKGFFKACYLAKHCLVHSGDKPFKCPDCGKCFTWSSQLAAHKWVHTGEKPFSCSDCCKRFSIKSQLHRHLKTHTGEKPFECRECGKCFINASHLSTHSLTHSGEKPFKCPECGKCYTRAHYLAIHKMIHTGEKPFSCSECEKCFSNKHQLQRHLRIHTPKKALQLPAQHAPLVSSPLSSMRPCCELSLAGSWNDTGDYLFQVCWCLRSKEESITN